MTDNIGLTGLTTNFRIAPEDRYKLQHQGDIKELNPDNLWRDVFQPVEPDYAFSNLSSNAHPTMIRINDLEQKAVLSTLLSKLGSPVAPAKIQGLHINNKTGVVSIYVNDQGPLKAINIGQFPVKDMVIKARFFDPASLKLSGELTNLEANEFSALNTLINEHLAEHNKTNSSEGSVMGFIDPPSYGIPADNGFKTWKDQDFARKLGQALAYHAAA